MVYYNLKWASVIASLSVLISVSKNQGAAGDETAESNFDDLNKVFPTPQTYGTSQHRSPVLIVSTLDGKVSALDANDGGRLIWSMDIGRGPLISSSISNLQVKQNGKIIRLIPSLSGGLFQFDGKTVEAVPFNADHLLSSSFKVADDSILVGGKDVTTFGLDSSTGKILYFCSSSGCETVEEASPGADVIIVKRRQQTVRSVENRNGREKWNFTVGEVELEISKGTPYQLLEHSGDSDGTEINDERVECEEKRESKFSDKEGPDFLSAKESDCTSSFKPSNFIKKLRVLVPEGILYKFEAATKNKLDWKYKFDSPIANAWYVNDGEHYKINLFDPKTVPALQEQNTKAPDMMNPTIYMGFHKTQAYIQVSQVTKKAVIKALIPHAKQAVNPYYQTIKFPYRPYLATSEHLTEAMIGEAKEGEITVFAESSAEGSCGNALAVYTDKGRQHDDVGYYFKSDMSYHGSFRESRRKGRTTVEDIGNDSYKDYHIDVVYSSFMHWWKEILIITVTTSVFMQFLIAKITQLLKKREDEVSKSNSADYTDAVADLKPQTSDASTTFESRYLHDFEPIQCLGKGGFGVVFESRNKVDDCSYAVKRISLPNKKTAREKVMREVRALAKLEHPCIVRYFNAWTEEPPDGWQQKIDQQLISDVSNSAHTTSLLPPTINKESKYTNSILDKQARGHLQKNALPPDKDFCLDETQSFSVSGISKVNNHTTGKNESFSIHFKDLTNQFDKEEKKDFNNEQSHLGKFFQTSSSSEDENDLSGHTSLNQSMPFSRYKQDSSYSVVFAGESGHYGSSGDSAIVSDVPGDKRKRYTRGHQRNVSDCAVLPTYEDIYGKAGISPGVRKRSASQKPTDENSDSAGSELRSVVCRQNSDKDKKKNKPKLSASVYLYIQMQLCQKESLKTWLEINKTRDHYNCLWIFQQVNSAVEYVHECNLIHRDLKPSNIFFSFDGSVKVGDFGLVTEMDEQLLSESNRNGYGNPGMDYLMDDGSRTERVGTRLYMAPEQMTSRNYSQKVDIFALGIILIELLTSFGTQMERVRELTSARQCKIGKDFRNTHPVEAKLAKQMLSHLPLERPTANQISTHEVFEKLVTEELFSQSNINWGKKRTFSK